MTKNQDLRIKNYEKNEEIREYNTEEKFYNALGMAWIPPELREDTGEVECALKQAQGLQPGLPKLVELKDIKGDLHIHSNYPIQPSHDLGTDSMEDMVKRAIELNYEFIGFSEHNPSVSNHTASQTYNILQERNEYIEKLREKYKKIKILSLMETDILVDGELALEEKSLNLLDGTLVSIHSSFKMNKIEMTKRVLQGFSHPKAKILSHPTGRLLEERPGYELNWDEVFDFAKTHNKALEINSSPNRLDLPDIIVREAVKSLVPLVIDTDSHALWQMDLMEYGVSVARRGWAEKKNILNTLSAKEFVDWLRS